MSDAVEVARIIATLDRRAELFDEIREAFGELRAEGPGPCCGNGCTGCPGGRQVMAVHNVPRGGDGR
jgi:hypothetical protein